MKRTSLLLLGLPVALAAMAFSSAARADDDGYGPYMKSLGNLRVDARCAEGMATPADGLRVYADGRLLEPKRIDSVSTISYDDQGNPVYGSVPVDVSFLAPLGRHLVRIEAADCAPMEREMNFSGSLPTHAEVDMPITTPSLLGTVGAPDGFTFVMSAYAAGLPGSMKQKDGYTLDSPKTYGGVFSFGFERRAFVWMFDLQYGGGSYSGAAVDPNTGATSKASGWSFLQAWATRFGARIPLRDVALEAGVGLGVDLYLGHVSAPGEEPGSGAHATWYVPLWAAATYKWSCNLGAQIGAAYHYDPTYTKDSAAIFTLGLVAQPSDACARSPGFDVIEP